MKCSFCELPLACKTCGKRFQPHLRDTHLAAYQPDMQIYCPECHAVLKCKSCGFVYGEEEEENEGEPGQ
jgi:hypothetical protein